MWILLRSDAHKEHYVAHQVEKFEYVAWVPGQIIRERSAAARRHMDRSNTFRITERPVCPSLLFANVPLPEVGRIIGIKHLRRVEQNFEGGWAVVPDEQVKIFKDAVDAENRASRMLSAAALRKRKPVWKTLQDAFEDLAQIITGPIEQAA